MCVSDCLCDLSVLCVCTLTANRKFWLVDVDGLITSSRGNINEEHTPFARREAEFSKPYSLLETIKMVSPHIHYTLSSSEPKRNDPNPSRQ